MDNYTKWDESQEPNIENHMMLAERYIEGLEDQLKERNDEIRRLKVLLKGADEAIFAMSKGVFENIPPLSGGYQPLQTFLDAVPPKDE